MKRVLGLVLAVAASASLSAAMPTASNVLVSMESGTAHVTFTLSDGPAFVTAEFLTNNVPMDAALYRDGMKGDVGKLLGSGGHAIRWQAHKTMPNLSVAGANLSAKLTVWPPSLPPYYMAVDLTNGSNVTYYASAEMVPGGVTDRRYKTDVLLMRRMDAAGVRWLMGQDRNDESVASFIKAEDVLPHWVTLTNDYYIGVYEMTQSQYSGIAGANPSNYQNENDPDVGLHPVEMVNFPALRGSNSTYWWPTTGHRVSNASVMGKMRAKTGVEFDLPTEAQWEFACRAGTDTPTYTGALSAAGVRDTGWNSYNKQDDPACLIDNGDGTVTTNNHTHVVGLKQPNPWGLYDMYGNVSEFCLDALQNPGNPAGDGNVLHPEWVDAYAGKDAIEPVGPVSVSGQNRAVRSSPYSYSWSAMRSTYRITNGAGSGNGKAYIGLRVACPAKAPDWMSGER